MSRSQADIRKGQMNTVKLFHKHVIEGKTLVQSAKEIGVNISRTFQYKKREDYRQMALEHLENSTLQGVGGAVGKLVEALEAVKPHNKEIRCADGSSYTETEFVADNATRMKALTEIHKIYGTAAPVKRDTQVAISFSSDEELFNEIGEAERRCRYVESYEKKGEGGFELAEGAQRVSDGDFETRKRAVLQDGAVQEPE